MLADVVNTSREFVQVNSLQTDKPVNGTKARKYFPAKPLCKLLNTTQEVLKRNTWKHMPSRKQAPFVAIFKIGIRHPWCSSCPEMDTVLNSESYYCLQSAPYNYNKKLR